MAYPNFSPSGGVGSTYTDPSTGVTYQYANPSASNPFGWVQISSGSSLSGATANTNGNVAYNSNPASPTYDPKTDPTVISLQNSINDILKQIQSTQSPKATAPVSNVPTNYTPPDVSKYVTDEYKKLETYYTQILKDNQGDVDRAKARLEEDYLTGKRFSTKEFELQGKRTTEDLQSSLANLGVKFPQEQENLLDTLNKRGIALTQEPGQGTKYAGGGRAAYELSNLTEDQRLRKEAVERTAQRSTEDLGLKQSKLLGDTTMGEPGELARAKTRGTEDIAREQQKTQQQLQSEREQKASTAAGLKLQEYYGQQQLDIANKQLSKMG